MKITIRQEAGYDLALYGFSLSYKDRAIKPEDWWCPLEVAPINISWADISCPHELDPDYVINPDVDECSVCKHGLRKEQIKKTATANAGRGKGHDKFLRQVMLWIDVEAPRYWWSEFDTYKVGTVAQSESTMHTLSRRLPTDDDFEGNILIDPYILCHWEDLSLVEKKAALPEGYLQRRLVTLNYAVLRTIIEQRKGHKLPEWKTFIDAVYKQVEHVELLPENPYGEGV